MLVLEIVWLKHLHLLHLGFQSHRFSLCWIFQDNTAEKQRGTLFPVNDMSVIQGLAKGPSLLELLSYGGYHASWSKDSGFFQFPPLPGTSLSLSMERGFERRGVWSHSSSGIEQRSGKDQSKMSIHVCSTSLPGGEGN